MSIEDEIMSGMRTRYQRSLPAKLEQLQAFQTRLGAGEDCGREIRSFAHKLVGSGASYGWLEISEAAARVAKAVEAEAGVAEVLADLIEVVEQSAAEQ